MRRHSGAIRSRSVNHPFLRAINFARSKFPGRLLGELRQEIRTPNGIMAEQRLGRKVESFDGISSRRTQHREVPLRTGAVLFCGFHTRPAQRHDPPR